MSLRLGSTSLAPGGTADSTAPTTCVVSGTGFSRSTAANFCIATHVGGDHRPNDPMLPPTWVATSSRQQVRDTIAKRTALMSRDEQQVEVDVVHQLYQVGIGNGKARPIGEERTKWPR